MLMKTLAKIKKYLILVTSFMSFKQWRILLKSLIESQSENFPLIWMFNSRRVNNKINHLHKRSLHMVCKDNYRSEFDLLAKGKLETIHKKNHSFAIKLFTVKRNLLNMIKRNILKTRTPT